ncbi:MAG: 5,10-methylenetetrahydromethanopterin reductase [Crenarchaeota archaeon]|nr:5,10-methylenetetrahydromethanopterin reductase [Thermoproteota archaeon]
MSIRVGVELLPTGKIDKIVELACLSESMGLDSVWVTDHYYNKNAYIILTLISQRTSKVLLGIGVTNPYVVHPAWTAGAAATLQEACGGRFILGIGAGDKTTLESIGIERKKALRAVRECIEIIRRLLNCETVTYDGEIFKLRNARLNIKTSIRVPIYVGAQAPKMLQLAGEIADGVIINSSDPEIVREAIRNIEVGAEKTNRKIEDIDIAVCTCFSVDEDEKRAVESAKIVVAYILAGLSREVAEKLGIDQETIDKVRQSLEKGSIDEIRKIITEEHVSKLAIAGTPEQCIEKIMKMIKVGTRHIILGSPLGPDKKKALEIIGRKIVQALKEKI